MNSNRLITLIYLLLFTSFQVLAGEQDNRSNCVKELTAKQKKTEENDRRIRAPREVEMSFKLLQVLKESDAELVIVGRTGSKLTNRKFTYPNGQRWKIQYTHAGFAIKDKNGWYFDHQLNTCAGASSDLYKQSLVEFFQDKSLGNNQEYLYNTEVIIPSLELQRQIKLVLQSNLREQLHERKYNKIAYPFSIIEQTGPVYQNSNQWLLEILAAAQMQLEGFNAKISRGSVQSYLKNQGYQPTYSKLSDKEKFFGVGLGVAWAKNTKFDDQPPGHVMNPIWVSVESIGHYLDQRNDLEYQISLCLNTEIGDECE